MTDEDDSEIDVRVGRRPGVPVDGDELRSPARHRRAAPRTRRAPGSPIPRHCNSCLLRQRRGAATRAAQLGSYSADERLGLQPQPPPRPHDAEVRRLAAVPDPALRPRASPRRRSRTAAASTRRARQLPGPDEPATARTPSSPPACPTARSTDPGHALQPAAGHAHAPTSSTTRTSAASRTSSCSRIRRSAGQPQKETLTARTGRRSSANDPLRLRLHGHRSAHDRVVPAAPGAPAAPTPASAADPDPSRPRLGHRPGAATSCRSIASMRAPSR